MNLNTIPKGATVLIDTNVLLYARNRWSLQCRHLLERCDQADLHGVVTLLSLAEFCHRRMMQEARANGLVGPNPARALGEKRHLIRQLAGYADDTRALLDGSLTFVGLQAEDFPLALEFQSQYGLMTNDSLNLALAFRQGLKTIATADMHFAPYQALPHSNPMTFLPS
jgi:predicted nucleic acid-binding protein